ncbi:MAG: ABC transporter transmembrane domain-containing protein [Pseudomonadota bacterium]
MNWKVTVVTILPLMPQTIWSTLKGVVRETLLIKSDEDGLQEPSLGLTIYAASAVVNILALALPLSILQIYDRVLPNAAFDTLTMLVVGLFCVILIDSILKYMRSFVANWAAASFTHKLSIRALSKMLTSPPSEFNRVTASEHLERLGAISGLGNHLGGQSRLVAIDILFIPIFAGVIMLVGGSIFLVMLVLFALFGSFAIRRTVDLNKVIAAREQMDSRKNDFFIEILRAMQTVKAHAMEPLIMRRFERLQSAASVITKRLVEHTGASQTHNAMYTALSVVAIVGVGALLVFNGRLTIGALACCMLLSSQLLQPLMRSLSAWNEAQLAKHRRGRIAEIFADENESQTFDIGHDAAHYDEQPIAQPVSFIDVTIQRGETKPLFQNLNLNVPAGAIVALRGVDGSGRTSLLRALMGDVAVTDGEIKIGETLITKSDHERTQTSVRYVPPTPTVFRGTIIENLTLFGAISANTALAASKLIGLDDQVVRLPLGYDTLLKSAAGRDIPTATAQRICIARAIATNPSVLIFDDANTLLDMSGEKRFGEALRLLRGKITIILATHRPSLIRNADAVYDVVDGALMQANAQTERAAG